MNQILPAVNREGETPSDEYDDVGVLITKITAFRDQIRDLAVCPGVHPKRVRDAASYGLHEIANSLHRLSHEIQSLGKTGDAGKIWAWR